MTITEMILSGLTFIFAIIAMVSALVASAMRNRVLLALVEVDFAKDRARQALAECRMILKTCEDTVFSDFQLDREA